MKIVLLLAGLAICLLGCVHSRVLTNETPPDTLAQMNTDFAGHTGIITLKNGERVGAKSFQICKDGLSYVTRVLAPAKMFPNKDIDRVAYRDRRIGLHEGLTSGALGGAIAGTALGFLYYLVQPTAVVYNSASDSKGYDFWEHRRSSRFPIYQCVGMGVLAGTISGTALGAFFGGTGGSIMEVRYRFPVSKPPK